MILVLSKVVHSLLVLKKKNPNSTFLDLCYNEFTMSKTTQILPFLDFPKSRLYANCPVVVLILIIILILFFPPQLHPSPR